MNSKWIVVMAISIAAIGTSVWFSLKEGTQDPIVDTRTVVAHRTAYIAVASKLDHIQAQSCAEAIVGKLGSTTEFMVASSAVLLPTVTNDDKGQLTRDLSTALQKGSPQTLNESSMTLKTAIVSATSSADTSKRTLVVVGQLPIDINAISKDQKSVLLDPTDVARLSERPGLLDIVFVVMPGTTASNDAIIRLRGLLNRRGVVYDSVLVRSGGMSR